MRPDGSINSDRPRDDSSARQPSSTVQGDWSNTVAQSSTRRRRADHTLWESSPSASRRGQRVRDTLSGNRGPGRGRGGATTGSLVNTQSAGGAERAARTGEERRVVRRVQLRVGSAGSSARGRESCCSTHSIMRYLYLPTPQSTQATS